MNPFLEKFDTPFETVPFDKIKTAHFKPAIEAAMAEGKAEVKAITGNAEAPTFANTIEALERAGAKVNIVAGVLSNLNSAETSPEIQELAKDIFPMITEYGNDILLDETLFARIKAVYEQKETLSLSAEQATLLDKTYKSFVRNGANLNDTDKQKLREIDVALSKLSVQFGQNVLADTNAYTMHLTNEDDLEGLPDQVREAAAMTAKQMEKEGWVFTLQYPSYVPFMTYASKRELREKLAKAYAKRGCQGNDNDNQKIVKDFALLRYERANLLGYATHADFVLEQRMASTPKAVENFLNDLLKHAKPAADKEMQELAAYAKKLDGIEEMQRWDYAYYSEKLKKEKFNIDDEMLKPYFELDKVIEGIFAVAKKLYGLNFKANADIPVYHSEVKAYEVEDEEGRHVSVFYADFFPREGKRNGAWMTSFRGQKVVNGVEQRPHVSIVCNFTKPTETRPSLLTFNEVLTFFHEFGHALHGMLASGNYESLSGTHVYWDFVELPSQIMENWVFEKETLDIFARHYKTGESIPADLIQRIKDSANYMQGYQTVRQISFGRLDMAWHAQDPRNVGDIAAFEREVGEETRLFPESKENNSMSCGFSHIFAGGYSAGYYSYKWAEVLDADAYEYFQENGIFDSKTAQSFKDNILAKGGSEHPMVLYKRFRGKEPSPEALLRRAGLIESK
ncbi:M3 family metallopeptidase [uncultured Microscilla sp.]|uniref:M3 family metallopeptidase n=1 Tax=uncultured Microscilla sp. TaxID=432653 RepID=UPI00261A7BE6|nr:M3 family metallopeptidase [uncultured Microscilla sp.]